MKIKINDYLTVLVLNAFIKTSVGSGIQKDGLTVFLLVGQCQSG